ncbi:trehalose operon repressor [Streptococcus dentiloxodontae]
MKKYEMIYKSIEEDILNGVFQVGDYLPTEKELTTIYQVSRDTVRKSLTMLVEERLIRKIHGSGSQVIKHEQINFPIAELTSYQELVLKHGIHSKTNVISIHRLIVDSSLSKLTGFPIHSIVWKITRQRVVDDSPSVLDIDYLSQKIIPEITRSVAENSIYDYLENELHLDISYAQKEITIDQIREQDKILLDIGSEHHVVSIKSKVYLANHQQFQFTDSRHKLEKFKFVDFAKRKH